MPAAETRTPGKSRKRAPQAPQSPSADGTQVHMYSSQPKPRSLKAKVAALARKAFCISCVTSPDKEVCTSPCIAKITFSNARQMANHSPQPSRGSSAIALACLVPTIFDPQFAPMNPQFAPMNLIRFCWNSCLPDQVNSGSSVPPPTPLENRVLWCP